MLLTMVASMASLLANAVMAAPLENREPSLKPVITSDFPDPSILKVGDTWYAFASQSAFDFKDIKVQFATSKDFVTWKLTGKDALGRLPSWVDAADPKVWAPSVSKLKNGNFLMYYSAITNTAGNGLLHCVGAATSKSIEGPYIPVGDEPFACPTDQGGALDASAFIDEDGTNYALWKIDANALGNGGTCGNTVAPIMKTPIMIQKVKDDGSTKVGEPVELINNSEIDGPLVEAPYMVRTKEGVYVLYFSSNCWTTKWYDVSYATSNSPMGKFTKTDVPLFITGNMGMIGPGGASIAGDGTSMALHGYANMKNVGTIRAMYVVTVATQKQKVVVQPGLIGA